MSIDRLKMLSLASCTGCGACVNACHLKAIELVADEEDFRYPQVAKSCVECGACEKACPQLEPAIALEWNRAEQGWLAIGRDSQVIQLSASGGAFATFAKFVIEKQQGVAFGAVMGEDFFVRHCCAESMDALVPMLGSKYVQSDIGGSFRDCKRFLEEGRMVLFSGTPCQIAGLYGFLGKHYENLITVDIVCHGVSAPLAFHGYIDYIEKYTGQEVASFRFRNRTKYDRAGFITRTVLRDKSGKENVIFRSAKEDVFFKTYLDGKLFRRSCYSCPYAKEKRISDITIGDCNSYRKYQDFHPYEGSSIILENSYAGKRLWDAVSNQFDYMPLDVTAEIKANGQLHGSSAQPPDRDEVCRDFAIGRFQKYEEDLLKHLTIPKRLRIWSQTHIPLKIRMKISGVAKWFKRKLGHGK